MRFVWMSLFGAMGANARYLVDGWVSRRSPGVFPIGTFVVNISGSFLVGSIFVVLTERFAVSPTLRSAITISFIGAYTTFSTLTFETLRLIEDGAIVLGMANALGSLMAGLIAVYLGTVVGRAL